MCRAHGSVWTCECILMGERHAPRALDLATQRHVTLVFAAALSKFARRATRYALARSEMWQQFLLGEVQLDLDDLHISLPGVLASVRRVVERMFTRTCAAAGVALLLWARLLA